MISKKKFIKYLNRLKALNQEIDEINKAYNNSKFFSLDISFYEYEELIIDMLEEVFQDKEGRWIDYFVYDLEFGTRWKKDMITDKNDKDIPLKNEEDLYNLLMENLVSKE